MFYGELGIVELHKFSKEKNTKAYKLKPQIPAKIKKQRKKQLMELQQQVSKSINEKMINKKIDCIIESLNEDGTITARTYKDAPEVDGLVYIKSNEPVVPGDIVTAKVIGAIEYDLIAEL